MPQVAISSDFFTAYAHIPQAQQKKVREFITRFQANPTSAGINYEPIVEVKDKRVRTVRIDLAYRAIVLHPQQGDVYVLVWVDHHDEAMEWARRKVFEVNPLTGALQVIDTTIVEEIEPAVSPKSLDDYGPFDTFSDDDLLRTGLPRPLLPAVRALKNADALDELHPHLPEEAYEALFWIAHLDYSVDQALAEVATHPATTKVDTDNIAAALEHPDSRRRFVVVKSADELTEMLNAPLAKWRIFLHPAQADLVRKDFAGPARVLGGAGTGKTVVAMHRARYLAAEKFTAGTDRILFTTYTKNLAKNIYGNLKNLCGPELERIEVVHLHSWAANFLRSQGFNFEIVAPDELDACWRDAFSAAGMGEWDEGFFRHEWERVIQTQGIAAREEYLQAPRTGQTVRLTRPQRAAVWEVFDEFKRNLSARHKIEWLELIRQTRLYLQEHRTSLPYRAVVVDETQDLHPEELKLIRQIVPEGQNDIFMVGDAHQRIYGRPVVLSQCGINIRGRSRRLRINYRTTEQIRNWSVAILREQSVDDLDGGQDIQNDYRSLLTGDSPVVKQFKTLREEQTFLVQTINDLLAGSSPETICVVARTHHQLRDDYLPALMSAGIECLYLDKDASDEGPAGVRLATMHRVKGLEFVHVLIVGANEGMLPLERVVGQGTNAERADSELQERCLFHVASSRARNTLTVTSYGLPSKWLAVLRAGM